MEIQVKLVCTQVDGDEMPDIEYDVMKVGNMDQLQGLVVDVIECARDWIFKEDLMMIGRRVELQQKVKEGFERIEREMESRP